MSSASSTTVNLIFPIKCDIKLTRVVLSTITFQYYPLDLNMESNPFVVSWWPRALADQTLFTVSIQTASLDQELRAQKGFPISEVLMADSVSLVRRKIDSPFFACQDETLNSVVALAAIEVSASITNGSSGAADTPDGQHGKGNIEASQMHIQGVLRMVAIRGGIHEVKRTNPLTARMVSW